MKAPERTRRRGLLLAGGAWLACATMASTAQTSTARRRIAVLLPGTHAAYESRLEVFRAELKRLGHVEGRDIQLEVRFAEGRNERLESLAAQLVSLGPAVILTSSSAGVIACKKATDSIPIVFATAGAPVEQGLVASLPRPGGNVTGVLVHSLEGKLVELAREALPQARRIAILVPDADPMTQAVVGNFLQACAQFKLEPVVVRVRRVEELATAFDEVARGKADALYSPGMVFTLSHGDYIIERSLQAKLPLLSHREEDTAAGGLLSYSTDRFENFRRAAALVDKILRGAKPRDLPVEQPERFRLVINRKTARAIGVTISPISLARADKIID